MENATLGAYFILLIGGTNIPKQYNWVFIFHMAFAWESTGGHWRRGRLEHGLGLRMDSQIIGGIIMQNKNIKQINSWHLWAGTCPPWDPAWWSASRWCPSTWGSLSLWSGRTCLSWNVTLGGLPLVALSSAGTREGRSCPAEVQLAASESLWCSHAALRYGEVKRKDSNEGTSLIYPRATVLSLEWSRSSPFPVSPSPFSASASPFWTEWCPSANLPARLTYWAPCLELSSDWTLWLFWVPPRWRNAVGWAPEDGRFQSAVCPPVSASGYSQ